MNKQRNGLSRKEASLLGCKVNQKKKEERIKKYLENPSSCKSCGKILSYEKRNNIFCSRSCSVSFNNIGVSRNNFTGKWAKKPCLFCEEETTN